MPHPRNPTPSFLKPGVTCWRASSADRATLLVDAEEYFTALRAALLQARHQILIAGWDFDSRIHLRPPSDTARSDEIGTAPTELAELLGYLIARRPELEIHVLRWDFHWMYRDDRELDTRDRLEQRGVRFHDDDGHVVTGCVHHKVVVIDDALAFCGGIDLTHKRWDTCAHDPEHPGRCDAHAPEYMPVHDTQLCVSGRIARDLGDYLRDSWPEGSAPPKPIACAGSPWPQGLHVDFRNISAAVSRTRPRTSVRPAAREIEALYLEGIASSRQSLYLENQYFTSTRIAGAIASQCRREPELQGLLVGMERPKTQIELHTMGYGLTQFYEVLRAEGAHERVPLVGAVCGETQPINLHSKLAVFDDRLLTVGSANLNRRSMGFDVECNVVLEAATAAHRSRMRHLRNRLVGEHLSMQPDEVAAAIGRHGLAKLPREVGGTRRLAPLQPEQPRPALGPLLAPLFDREEQLPLPAPISAPSRLRMASPLLRLSAIATLTILSGSLAWKDWAPPRFDLDPCADRRPDTVETRLCEAFEHVVELAR